ncbi:MAG TPA: hypothetical protein VIK91_24435 [Nannocystis sp.]
MHTGSPSHSPALAHRAIVLALVLAGLGTALAAFEVSPLILLALVCLSVCASLAAAALVPS